MTAERKWDVFVSVGTDHHEFSRVIQWTENWAQQRDRVDRCFIQYGHSPAPTVVPGSDYLTHRELQQSFHETSVVVTHGGPGTILGARAAGLRPVVVPRRAALGEHVDDHQWYFSRRMAESQMLTLIESEEDYFAALDRFVADPQLAEIEAEDDARVADAVEHFGTIADRLINGR